MKIKDIINNDHFTLINEASLDNVINNTFVCDLLSHVMGTAEEDDLLVTVLNNINVLGVASLLDLSGVIFTHNVIVNKDIITKANELEIPLIQTNLTSSQTVILIHQLGEHD